jgi:hypothetical protein
MKLSGPAFLWLIWWVLMILAGLGGINDTISVSRAASISPGVGPITWAAVSVYGGVQLARDLIRLMRLRARRVKNANSSLGASGGVKLAADERG